MKTGIELIKKEREKQLSKYSIEDDSICNCACELSRVAYGEGSFLNCLLTVEYNRRWGLEVLNPDLPTKVN